VGSDSIEYDKIGNPTIWGQKNEDGIWFNGALLEWQGRELQKYHPFTEYDNGSGEMYYPVYFKYNDEGIRTYKEQDGIDHEYILDGSKIVGEWIYNRTILILYIYDETGSPIGMKMRTSSQAEGVFDEYFFEKNLQGDIVAIYNASGAKIGTYTYDAWGNFTVTASGSDTEKAIVNTYNPFRYRGYYYDVETGLYYLQSRYYNPNWGRFINADAYVSTGQGLIGNNMFAYCNNNPANGCDPCGTCRHRWDFWNDCPTCENKTFIEQLEQDFDTAIDFIVDFVTDNNETMRDFRDIHYNRNNLNSDPPQSFVGWDSSENGGPEADCHQFTSPDKSNIKYVSSDGHKEFIVNSQNDIVDDPRDVGTYNFVPSNKNGIIGKIGHAAYDVIPWIVYGNSVDDTTTIFDRVGALMGR